MPELHLRRPRITDVDAVFRIHSDPRTNLFNPAGPATRDRASDMLSSWLAHWDEQGFGYWAVSTASQPDAVVGFGGIMRKRVAHLHGLNMYFRFAPEAWGRGYATQLARAALRHAFTHLGAPEVIALVRSANAPSRRTLERVGFVQFATAEVVPGEESSLIYRASPDAA